MAQRFKVLAMFAIMAAFLFTVTQLAAAEANPGDVPPTHWAYKAVKLLIDKGYLQLYQDQTFQGDKPVDRYTMAMVVAKILNEIAAGQVGTSKEDLTLLKSLTNEYRGELVDTLSKIGSTDKKIEYLARDSSIIKEDLTKTNVVVQNLSAEQLELQKEVQQMLADMQSLKEQNTKLKADLERLRAEMEENRKKQNLYILVAAIFGLYGAVK
ncbi:MAG: S-layer homology domain-containing protein [Bacillota bacterium]